MHARLQAVIHIWHPNEICSRFVPDKEVDHWWAR